MKHKVRLLSILIITSFIISNSRSFAFDLPQYGKTWDATFNDTIKLYYVNGFLDGRENAVATIKSMNASHHFLTESQINRLNEIFRSRFDPEAITNVMNSLYKDAANNNIPWTVMIGIAERKLAGSNVEESLRFQRQVQQHSIKGSMAGKKDSLEYFKSKEFKEQYGLPDNNPQQKQ